MSTHIEIDGNGLDVPDYDQIVSSIRPENLLGAGGANAFFAIDGNPDFGVRISGSYLEGAGLKPGLHGNPDGTVVEGPLGARNFGQAVVDHGIFTVNFLQGGRTARLNDGMFSEPTDADRRARYLEVLREAAGMPVEAYEGLIRDAGFLAEKGFAVDPKATNLLVDPKAGRFNLIDFHPAKQPVTPISPGFLTTMIKDVSHFSMGGYSRDFAMKAEIEGLHEQIQAKMKTATENLGMTYTAPPKPPPPPPIRKTPQPA